MRKQEGEILVGILLGSLSDADVMAPCKDALEQFFVPYDARVCSAHRTPDDTEEIVKQWIARGCKVFICAAGMAAHLAGVVASKTIFPVIGVPIAGKTPTAVNGLDALLSTLQMPPGIPVATVAINGSANAAYLAIQMLAIHDARLHEFLASKRMEMAETVRESDKKLWVPKSQ